MAQAWGVMITRNVGAEAQHAARRLRSIIRPDGHQSRMTTKTEATDPVEDIMGMTDLGGKVAPWNVKKIGSVIQSHHHLIVGQTPVAQVANVVIDGEGRGQKITTVKRSVTVAEKIEAIIDPNAELGIQNLLRSLVMSNRNPHDPLALANAQQRTQTITPLHENLVGEGDEMFLLSM